MSLYLLGPEISRLIWKYTENSQTNATNQCDNAISEGGSLRRHLKTQSGEEKYRCNTCNYASPQTYHLRTHLKKHGEENSNRKDSFEKIWWKNQTKASNVTKLPVTYVGDAWDQTNHQITVDSHLLKWSALVNTTDFFQHMI